MGVHALGYVGTISEDDMQRVDRERYFGTGVIGKTGVERAYEDDLLGTVTAGNSSQTSDGAAAVALASVSPARTLAASSGAAPRPFLR